MFSKEIVTVHDLHNKGTEGNENITSFNVIENNNGYAPGNYAPGNYSKKSPPLS